MKTLITRIKRLALALCFVTPLVSWAATTTGYEDFGDTAGVQLWRTAATGSGVTDFAFAKFAAVAADGTVGETYTQGTSSTGTHWRRWASKFQGGDNSTYYTAPGLVLVYDKADLMATPSNGATFAPLSFGGLWVKKLGANDTPYGLTDAANKGRATEFGATGYATLFKFEKSFTINRGAASTFYGTATVNITGDAVFTASTGYATVVDADATLKLTGDSTAAMSVGTGLTVNGTLDLTASTLPTISGNVTLSNGSSLVLPAGVATGEAISVAVCSGTLAADGVVSVKIGTADPINAALTISGGAITQIDETVVEQTFPSDYPSVVPAGYIYTFTASAATTLPSVTVNGTLKTEGDFTITDLKVAAAGALEVVSGNTTVGGAATCQIKGKVTVDAGATLTNTLTDSLDYNGSMTVDISGTLAMGSTRWSIPSGCTFNLRGGASVTGTGDSLASLDIINAGGQGLNVYAGTSSNLVTIEGPVRVRANLTRIWVASGTTLVLQSGIVEKNQQSGSFQQTGPGTLELAATSTSLTGSSSSQMTQGTLRLNNTTRAFPLELHGAAALEIVATDAATTVPVNVTSINGNGVTLTGSGKANGTITKTAVPSGNLASFLQSSAWEGTFVADWAGAHDTRFDINSYGNANSTVRVTKLVGGYVSGSNANVTVVPTVEVSGFMTLENGYSGKVTTLTKLTGSGVFTNKTYSVDVTTLDNFTGTLATLIGTQYVGMKIGTINLSSAPAAGAKIVNVTSDSNIGNIGNTKVSVNGVVDDTITLEVKSDGIYVVVPTVTITVPEVANTTVTVANGGETIGTAAGNYEVAPGSVVTVTYAAASGYVISGTTEYTIDTSKSETTFEITDTTTAQYVAEYNGVQYETVQEAIDAAVQAGQTYAAVTILDQNATCPDGYYVDKENSNTLTKYQAAIIQNNEGVISTNYFKTAQLAVDAIEANVYTYLYYSHFEVYSGTAVPIAVNPSAMAWNGFSVNVKCLNGATVAVTLDSTESELTAGDADANGIVSYTKTDKATTYVWVASSASQWARNTNWKVGTSEGATATRYPGAADTVIIGDGANITGVSSPTSVAAMQVSGAVTISGGGSLTSASAITLGSGDSITITGTLSPTPTTTVANSYVKLTDSTYSVQAFVTVTIPVVENASATVNGDAVAGGASVRVDAGSNVTIAWTAASGYKITDGATQTINAIAENVTATAPTVEANTVTFSNFAVEYLADFSKAATITATVTGDGAAEATYTITAGGEPITGTYSDGTVTFENVGNLSLGDTLSYTISASGTTSGSSGAQTSTVGNVTDGWVVENSGHYESTGSWTTDFTYTDGKATITDNTYTANTAGDGIVTLTTVVKFGGDADSEVSVGDNAQAAVRVQNSKFEVYGKTTSEGTADWQTTAVSAEDETTYTVTLTINYTTRKFTVSVDGTLLGEYFLAVDDATKVSAVAYKGTGEFTSLNGSFVSGEISVKVDADDVAVSSEFISEYLGGKTVAEAATLLAPGSARNANGCNYFESYALGLNPTNAEDKLVVDVTTDSSGNFVFTVKHPTFDGEGNITGYEVIDTADNVPVTVTYKYGTTAGSTTTEAKLGEGDKLSPSAMFNGQSGNVLYYKAEVTIGTKE